MYTVCSGSLLSKSKEQSFVKFAIFSWSNVQKKKVCKVEKEEKKGKESEKNNQKNPNQKNCKLNVELI